VQKWHGRRNEVIKDRRSNKDDSRSTPGINSQVEPEKDGCSGGDVGWIRKAALVWRIQAQDCRCSLRMRRQPAEYSRRLSDCRSRNEKMNLLSGYWRSGIGPCGGVDPLLKEKTEGYSGSR
jgi:hypothetical protein